MPCLNEICFNIVNERDLYMTSFFRSNDVYGALYYNMRGLTKLGEYTKEKIEELNKILNILKQDYENLKNTDIKDIWIQELIELEKEL